jgi:dipeptidyl aminopeptidase/acylaminoacyl peptidase
MSISAIETGITIYFRRVLAGFVLLAGTALSAEEPPSAAELYGALPLARDVRLSPDGNSLALIAAVQGREQFVIWHLDGAPPTNLATGDSEPRWFAWKDDGHLLAGIYYGDFRNYHKGAMSTRTLAFDADGSRHVTVLNFADLSRVAGAVPQFQDHLLSPLPDDPDHVLMQVGPVERPRTPDVFKVDIHSGEPQRVLDNRLGVFEWLADWRGVVRIGKGYVDGRARFYGRLGADTEWMRLADADGGDEDALTPIALSDTDPATIYWEVRRADGFIELREYDGRAGRMGKVIAGAPGVDTHGVVIAGKLVGYRFGDGDVTYFDADWQKMANSVRKVLPDRRIELVDRSADGKRFLVFATAIGQAPSYWLLDLRGPKAVLNPLFQNYDAIPPEQIAPVTEVTYTARDGLEIPAFLTLPVNRKPGPLPFVVLPHGGPLARDTGQFDYMAQFLAALGYGVLQPQFRGSTGRGWVFEQAGYGQWGRKSQDDITDGTHWLIDQGYADPGRIAIAGASYGGYAALMGAEREPALYRCAVSISGVADLAHLVNEVGTTYGGLTSIPDVKEKDVPLTAISPVKHTGALQVPVLLMHGRRDFTVPVDHSEAMERALRHVDKPVEAVYFDDADHFFTREKDRVAMLRTLQSFLRRVMPAS